MTEIETSGQMHWKLEDNERVLYLRHNDSENWRYYEDFPQYCIPEPQGFTKGIATFLALRAKGWTVTKD